MTVTRRLAAIPAADCDEISETGLLVAHFGRPRTFEVQPLLRAKLTWRRSERLN